MKKLDQFGVSFCVLDNQSMVVDQSNQCKMLCGEKMGELCTLCTDKVLDVIRKDAQKIRYKIFENDVRLVIHQKQSESELTFLIPVDSELSTTILSFLAEPDLSAQEKEVLKLICEGYSNEEMIEILVISKSTIKTHINHLHQKIPGLVAFRKKYL